MKRSDALRLLSVEHHHGLFQVSNIKKALKEKTDLEPVAATFLADWDEVIGPHFDIEEEVLIPPYTSQSSHNAELVETFHAHHQALRNMVSDLRKSVRVQPDQLEQLADLMKEHIRFEERWLFPDIEKVLRVEELVVIGQETKKRCKDYDAK